MPKKQKAQIKWKLVYVDDNGNERPPANKAEERALAEAIEGHQRDLTEALRHTRALIEVLSDIRRRGGGTQDIDELAHVLLPLYRQLQESLIAGHGYLFLLQKLNEMYGEFRSYLQQVVKTSEQRQTRNKKMSLGKKTKKQLRHEGWMELMKNTGCFTEGSLEQVYWSRNFATQRKFYRAQYGVYKPPSHGTLTGLRAEIEVQQRPILKK